MANTTSAPAKPIISFRNITKRWGSTLAVDDVTLDIQPGEFFALLGPSGCGKTTLLRMLAGLEVPSEGHVLIDGQDMRDIPPNKRAVNMVFQSYAVFPHMSVADNVGYGLKIDRVSAAERKDRVQEALELVQLGHLATRMPDQLSGGQRQRVALARALVKRPKVLLLDEPLSALDAKLREAMRFELSQLQQKVGITFIMVTHDQDEALAIACRIAVMDKGSIAQLGTPSDLYEFPASRFVADFIGSVNMFEGTLTKDEPDEAIVVCPELAPYPVHVPHGVSGSKNATVWVAIRPEKMTLHKDSPEPPSPPECPERSNVAKGEIKDVSYLGDISIYHVQLDNGTLIRVSRPNRSRWDQDDFDAGDKVWVSWAGSSPVVLQT
ncbi:MAG: ABC transporter ATP-binding protein [Hyphomicrobiales bacterium]